MVVTFEVVATLISTWTDRLNRGSTTLAQKITVKWQLSCCQSSQIRYKIGVISESEAKRNFFFVNVGIRG